MNTKSLSDIFDDYGLNDYIVENSKTWTVEKVKEYMPNISVKLGDGTIVKGYITGRKPQFAIVKIWIHNTWMTIEVAWGTIAHCLNNDKPILA